MTNLTEMSYMIANYDMFYGARVSLAGLPHTATPPGVHVNVSLREPVPPVASTLNGSDISYPCVIYAAGLFGQSIT